jgi:hypothetical protein
MSLDLENILRDWPNEPGQIKVRKITGDDGREKVQLRLDLGLIQMNIAGRPDGLRPHGCDSLLEFHQARAREAEEAGERYALTADEVGELQQEGIQYYHRYISLFQLEEFDGVVRDTARNIELFDFVKAHADGEEAGESLEQFRPYVLMMNTRARAALELKEGRFEEALRQIERGRSKIERVYRERGDEEAVATSPEIQFLDEWLGELKVRRPVSKVEAWQREMDDAIAREMYERAAELRDMIRAHRAGGDEA